jgi:signal transduction histidine kinase
MMARRDWKLPAAYCVLLGGMHGVLRTTPAGGGVDAGRALLDGVYALALALALLVLTVGVRLAARSVDVAQQNALQRYADAQIDQATEYERVQIDALVHDRVLTTFLTAAKAASPKESALAERMARTAIEQLAAAQRRAGQEQEQLGLAELAQRIRSEAGAAADGFSITVAPDVAALPAPAAEAIAAAAAQAMVNSVNHAGDAAVVRTVDIRAVDGGVVTVVADRGTGFDLAAIAPERLGVRVSIIERMHATGGRAEVRSSPGRGTVVTLVWPGDAAVAAEDPATGIQAVAAR